MNTMNRFPRIGVGILIVLFRIRETFHMDRVERRFSDMYLLRTSGDGAHKPIDIIQLGTVSGATGEKRGTLVTFETKRSKFACTYIQMLYIKH